MLTEWILSLMTLMQPQAPWSDTYFATAAAIDHAVEEKDALFPDPDGRAKTAALLVSLAWAESTFKPNAVGHGGVRGLYQIGGHGDLSDALKASRVAIDLVRESFLLCAKRPLNERLSVYATGGTSCKDPPSDALAKSRFRVMKGLWLVKQRPPPLRLEDAGAADASP